MKTSLVAAVFRYLLLSFLLLILFSSCQEKAGDDFTQEDVRRITQVLNELDEDEYRIVLPVFKDSKIVGSEVYGNLPITEVRRVAISKGISYVEKGNLQAIFQSCEGGGAGSHVNSDSAARGNDSEADADGNAVYDRIDQILKNIDKSKFIQIRK
ncbi:hypothetical protein [Aquimarina pacifica]|uniref:hypothetical protein n=1 Tax=Aquimarina pacifica TaxID=1296415 RepID=UPI000471A817|nr:hypothetical protein [Aquimarina pacifica]